MTEPTDAPQPDPTSEFDPELTADLTAALGGATSFFPSADDEPDPAADAAPLAPSEPEPLPGEPGTAGAALAGLAGGYGGSYEPYYGTPSPWSSDRLEAIMRDTVDAQAQEQRQLETLLVDVREALTRLGEAPPPPEQSPAQADAIDRLATELAAARAEQEQRFADLTARIDALAPAAPEDPDVPAGPSIQDLHDGLAGVRTDMTALPEQIGPAVTSAVAHGLAETNTQVGLLRQSLADTVTETTELRSAVAAHADHLALLPDAVAGIQDLMAKVANLEEAAASREDVPPATAEPIGPEVTAIVDEQLGTHLETFGVDVGEQLNAVRAQVTAVEESLGATVRERLGAFEERLDALHEVLVALHGSEERDLPPALVVRLDELEGELRSMRLANEGPTSPMTSVVAQLHASEQRLAHHVDEAVLALAQAVLRRRTGGTGQLSAAESGDLAAAEDDGSDGPDLPADELAAAEMDSDLDADADVVHLEDEPAAAPSRGDVVEAWSKGDAEAVDVETDREEETEPGPDVRPGPSTPDQDTRRGRFRRRS